MLISPLIFCHSIESFSMGIDDLMRFISPEIKVENNHSMNKTRKKDNFCQLKMSRTNFIIIPFLSTPKLTLFMLWLLTVKAKEASFCMIEKTALCLEVCMYMFLIYIHIYSHTLGTTYTYTQCSTPIKLSVSQMIAFLFPIKYASVYVKLLRRVYSYPILFLDNLCLSYV